jgi:hypothetical protein
MAMVTSIEITSWRASGHPYKLIAAAIAEWAMGRERGTVLPDNEFFGIEGSPSTYRRAKAFLVTQGVLCTNDGPYQVVLRASRLTFIPGKVRRADAPPGMRKASSGHADRPRVPP